MTDGLGAELGIGPRIQVPADVWIQVNDAVARYSHLLDAGRYDLLAELFTEHAVFDTDPHPADAPADYPFPAHGRDATIAALRSIRSRWEGIRSRHTTSNVTVVEFQGRRLRALTAFSTLHTRAGALPKVHSAGHYDDVMVLDETGVWKISDRTVCGDRVGAFHGDGRLRE